MKNMNFYLPFITKLNEWVEYDEKKPRSNYMEHYEEHDAFRATHDRDCVLTGGNLYADTIFSLWLPMRNTILRINTKEEIEAVGKMNGKINFSRCLLQNDNLERLLPADNSLVQELRKLFVLGLKRCNVMILPDRRLNAKRGFAPYYDYMPRFLYELFEGGDFENTFESEEELVKWIREENLVMFFEGEICRQNIKDLSGSGDIKNSFAPEGEKAQEQMIHNYYEILEQRDMAC